MKHLLFLHGAGPTTDKTVHQYLEEALLPYNIESCSFDFYGHGEKKIPLSESSLKKRYVEAKQAIQDFHLTEPLNICGSSMGGYIAIKLLEEFKVQNLILFCPAIYDTKAFDVPFDERFTSIIRKEHSWMQTDAFDTFKKFTGNVLIFIGENPLISLSINIVAPEGSDIAINPAFFLSPVFSKNKIYPPDSSSLFPNSQSITVFTLFCNFTFLVQVLSLVVNLISISPGFNDLFL